MQIYKTIIVDDEIAQQELLCDELSKHFPQIEVCAVCPNADSAMIAVATHQPQLVFLDVEMPGRSGIEFLQQFENNIPFEVIFATSHAGYAVNAFEIAAVHYLLKPFGREQLEQALLRFENRLKSSERSYYMQNLLYNLAPENKDKTKISAYTTTGAIFPELQDVIYCESNGKFTIWHLTDKSQHIVLRAMKECETILIPNDFVRIHKSYLVNRRHVKRYVKKYNHLEMSNGKTLELSRKFDDDLGALGSLRF